MGQVVPTGMPGMGPICRMSMLADGERAAAAAREGCVVGGDIDGERDRGFFSCLTLTCDVRRRAAEVDCFGSSCLTFA